MAASFGWDGPGLGSAELTYHIANSPGSLSLSETTAAIETALAAWAGAADITFSPTTQSGLLDSIDISFTEIDGAGGTLAQAYFPDDVNPARIAGDIQFDIAEVWEVGNDLGSQAFDLIWVAAHEIGHSLGLDHLEAEDSVLQPFVSPNQLFAGLSPSDVEAIEGLYAPAEVNQGASGDADEVPEPQTPVVSDELPTEQVDPAEEIDSEETDASDDSEQDDIHCRGFGFVSRSSDQILDRFDSDGDGVLSESEVGDRVWNRLASLDVDTDGDGVISLDELDAAIAAGREAKFERLDSDNDGLIMEQEVAARFWTKISEADTDSDGGVSLDEFAEWLVARNDSSSTDDLIDHHRADRAFSELGNRANARGFFGKSRRIRGG